MDLDRSLIDSIKLHFAKKSKTELQEIVRVKDLDRWSEEAFVAADEVLAERAAGRAKEPRVPVKDAPPPSAEERRRELLPILGYVTGGLVGGLIGKILAEGQPPDRPVPFGSNIAWLAVESTDTGKVALALGLQSLREATWAEGIDAASRSAVFVTPPLGDWTLAVSTALFPPEEVAMFVKPLLEPLSRQFRDAQYFCTHRDLELHAWARAQKGRLLRGYAWHGQESRVLWNEGAQMRDERSLGFRFTNDSTTPPTVERAEDRTSADESCVMQIAALWSVDPSALDELFQEPFTGLRGDIPRR